MEGKRKEGKARIRNTRARKTYLYDGVEEDEEGINMMANGMNR